MMRITDVVKHLLIINVLVFFVTLLVWGDPARELTGSLLGGTAELGDWERYMFALFFPTSPYFRPYQLVSHMFMHGDIGHLLFNMLGLFMFGTMVEMLWGERKFLFFYLFCGFGSMLLYLGMKYLELYYWGGVSFGAQNTPMLGASGAIFGVMMAFMLNYPNEPIGIFFLPIRIPAKYLIMAFFGYAILTGFGIIGGNRGVADFAHIGGAIFGYFLIVYWEKFGTRL
jgi:membrane associated rhomboid family serine protease